MPLVSVIQNSFGQGELGDYMSDRADLEVYKKSAQIIENCLVLPHGGLQYRRGFEFVYDLGLSAVDAGKVMIDKFSFNRTQEYVLVFTNLSLLIFRDKSLAATVVTTYALDDVRDIKLVNQGDTLIMVHEDYVPRKLERLGTDIDWRISDATFTILPYHIYNPIQTLTPSATSGAITLTLSGTDGYWNAGHVGVDVKVNTGKVDITGIQQDATGGTAYASAGTAANAFDANPVTIASAGVDGWIGYDFTTAQTVRIFGIKSNISATYTLIMETDDNATFTSATTVGTATVVLTAGTMAYSTVPLHVGERYFRVRESGGANLDVQDIEFNKGLVVKGTVDSSWTPTTLSATTADEAWTEPAWGTHHGYPRTVGFVGPRLVFGGTKDAPATIFVSKDGDLFNFDDSATTAAYAFGVTAQGSASHEIRNMITQNKLLIFTSDGEYELDHTGAALEPTTVQINPQSNHGCNTVNVTEIDGEVHFFTANDRELRSFIYSFSRDLYQSDSKTTLAHHIFDENKKPISMSSLNSYRDTQANFLFVVREDGQMAILTLDSSKEVLAWSRFTTDGTFEYSTTAYTDHGSGVSVDTLYTITNRTNGTFLECLTTENVWLDHWYVGVSGTPKTTWSGLTTLEGELVRAVGDGLVQGDFTVASGSITLDNNVSEIEVGLPYTATIKTQNFVNFLDNKIVRGRQVTKKRAIVGLLDTMTLKIDGYAVPFRQLGTSLLDQPLSAFSGQKERHLKGNPKRDQTVIITIDEPLPCTLLSLTTDVLLG